MVFNIKEIKETIRITNNKIIIEVLIASGKEGNAFVVVSPALLVSGYGSSESEAKESFEHNIEVFCNDILALSQEQRDTYLKKLGFSKEKYKNKNFSKLYIDKNGILRGFDQSTIKTSILEASF